jgi:hypothetical protein
VCKGELVYIEVRREDEVFVEWDLEDEQPRWLVPRITDLVLVVS